MSASAGNRNVVVPTMPMARYVDPAATRGPVRRIAVFEPPSAAAVVAETSRRTASLSSHLLLEARRLRRSEGRNVVSAFEQARARVMAVANAHEWLTCTGDSAPIEFGAYVRELCTDLAAIFLALDRPSLSCEAAPRVLPSTDGVWLGLVVTELVTNAFTYGFPDARGGRIAVTFTALPETSLLMVEDSGCDWHPSGSCGSAAMRVVRALVDHLGGVLEVPGVIGGNRCTVILPAP